MIPFERTFAPGEQISRTALDAQLADPSELSGVLNLALEALRAMRARGAFTQSETTSAATREFIAMTDPIAAWLDKFTVVALDSMVSRKDLGIAYNAFAEANGSRVVSAKTFYLAARRLRPTIQEAQRTICGSIQMAFLGVRLKVARTQGSTEDNWRFTPFTGFTSFPPDKQ